jgi:hypothetical protein
VLGEQLSKNMNKGDYHISELQNDQSVLLEELEKIKMEILLKSLDLNSGLNSASLCEYI